MLTPFDLMPRHTIRPGNRAARLRGLAAGILLAVLLCIVMRVAGAMAAIVVFYLIGLAAVLKAMMPAPPSPSFSTQSNKQDDLIGIRPTIGQH